MVLFYFYETFCDETSYTYLLMYLPLQLQVTSLSITIFCNYFPFLDLDKLAIKSISTKTTVMKLLTLNY